MTDVSVHVDDTNSVGVTIPRDLTDTTVTAEVSTDSGTETLPTEITDAANGRVFVSLDPLTVPEGVYEIQFRLQYPNDTTEVLPPEGDLLRVYDSTA